MNRPLLIEGDSSRKNLGIAIRYCREQRSITKKDAANKCGVSLGTFDDWETGKAVPDTGHWRRLKDVSAAIADYSGLRVTAAQEEAAEVEAERERRRTERVAPFLVTPLAEKLAAAEIVAAATPLPPPVLRRPAVPDDVTSAVQLLLESIPNLRSFSIVVDDDGNASWRADTREVRVVEESTAGKIKVRK